MTIKSTFVLTSTHTVVKILSGIVMNKVVAIYLGPSGLALIGQFQNFSGIVTGVANASIQTGIVKKTAESDDAGSRERVWVNALFLSVGFSILTSIVVFILAEYFARTVMFDDSYYSIIQFFACSIIFYSLNLYLLSIINGLGEIKLYSIINICLSLFTLLAVSLLTIFFHLKGAIVGLIITQSFILLLSYLFIYKSYKNLFFSVDFSCLDKNIIKTLLIYGGASLTSGIVASLTMILVRNIIVDDSTLNEAGIWEAGLKIGIYFNLLFTLPITIHYLPVFSKVKSCDSDIKFFIKQAIFFVSPIMIVTLLGIYLFSDTAIAILFSKEFLMLGEFLFIILLAEMIRVISAVYCTLLFAKQALIASVKNEVVRSLVIVIGAFMLMDRYGLFGVAISYMLASCLYLIVTYLSCRKYIVCN